jgi:hypothetical protein
MRIDDTVDLGHEADGLFQGRNDALIVGDIVIGKPAALCGPSAISDFQTRYVTEMFVDRHYGQILFHGQDGNDDIGKGDRFPFLVQIGREAAGFDPERVVHFEEGKGFEHASQQSLFLF